MSHLSKFPLPVTATIDTTCLDFIHPWTDSCLQATSAMYLYSIFDSLRIYGTVYMLTLLMKGRIPTKDDIKKTLLGICQSTAFLSAHGFGYPAFLCLLRRFLGHFNILTASAIPAFLSSVFAILIERPSRRTLLCLYVSNVATETLWNMAAARGYVANVKHGDAAIFSASMAVLMCYYKAGWHRRGDGSSDSMFSALRFVVGEHEEGKCGDGDGDSGFYRQRVAEPNRDGRTGRGAQRGAGVTKRRSVLCCVNQALRAYRRLVYRIKCWDRHPSCPHPFGCLYYTLEGAGKMFSVGLSVQLTLKVLLNSRKIVRAPSSFARIVFRRDTLNLAAFLGGFAGLFRATLCVLRRTTGRDSPKHALLAGLLAGLTFTRYPDNTVALYVMWKVAQVTYNMGIDRGVLPRVPGFTEALYCFSTAILFHAAMLEPRNLRPSYWKFLHSISGGRIACMDRVPLDAWGLRSSESLNAVLGATRTQKVVSWNFERRID